MSSESRKQFGEVVFATGPVSTHLPPTLVSSPENRSLRLQEAALRVWNFLLSGRLRWGSWGWWPGWGRGWAWGGRWRQRAPTMGSPPRLCRSVPKVGEQIWNGSHGICKGGRNGKQFAAKHWLTLVVFFLAAACATLLVLLQQANAEVGYYLKLLPFSSWIENRTSKYPSLARTFGKEAIGELKHQQPNNSHFKRWILSMPLCLLYNARNEMNTIMITT